MKENCASLNESENENTTIATDSDIIKFQIYHDICFCQFLTAHLIKQLRITLMFCFCQLREMIPFCAFWIKYFFRPIQLVILTKKIIKSCQLQIACNLFFELFSVKIFRFYSSQFLSYIYTRRLSKARWHTMFLTWLSTKWGRYTKLPKNNLLFENNCYIHSKRTHRKADDNFP